MILRYILPTFIYFGYVQSLWMILAYIPLHLEALGFSQLQISFLISLLSFFPLLVVVPLGVFSDRISPKKMVILGLFLLALFAFLVQFIDSFQGFLFLFVIGGIGNSIFLISCSSLYYKLLQGGSRGIKIGFFAALGNLGYGVGPLLGSVLLQGIKLHDLFVVIFYLTLPFIALSFFLLDVKPEPFSLGTYRKDLSRFEVLILIGITFLVATHFGAERTTMSLFLKFNAGVAEDQMGIIFFCVGIVLTAVIFSIGFFSDIHANLKMLFLLGLLFSGTFNIAMIAAHSFYSALTIRLLHVIGDSFYLIAQRIAISHLFKPHRVGGHIGVLDTMTTFGTFVGALFSGLMPGYASPFVVTGALSFAGAFVLFFLKADFSPQR